jgi:predicted glycoside hydrolase/deacetylase ChbG (UPF0249 family)
LAGEDRVGEHKTIVLAADDYGMSGGVCDGIEELIVCKRLSATGAMTGLAAWRRHGAGLRRLVAEHPADIGLHLTLTDQRPLTNATGLAVDGRLPSIGRLMRRAFARTLPLDTVREELRAQLDAFEEVWGGPPDFIDGHQHVQLLPGVRTVVIEEMVRRYEGTGIWLRSCHEPVAQARARGIGFGKALTIGTLGLGLEAHAARFGIPTNDSFRGLYDFSERPAYAEVFRRSLTGPGKRILVHCHPGHVDEELRALDPLLEPREREFAYLSSPECGEALDAAGMRLGRFRDMAPTSFRRAA